MKNFTRLVFSGLLLLFVLESFLPIGGFADFANLILSRFSKTWMNTPQEKAYLLTDKPYYSAGEDIWFRGFLVNATTHAPQTFSRYLYVELLNGSDSLISRVKIRKDSIGFAGNIKLKPQLAAGYYTLRAFTFWMQNATADYFFTKNIYIGNQIDERKVDKPAALSKRKSRQIFPEDTTNFDLQFFPESGNLLNGQMQLVAFKAIGTTGLSVEVEGKVFNNKEEELTSFSSMNHGMGKFLIESKTGESYYAVVKSSLGVEKRFNLPSALNEGVAIHLVQNRGKILYEIVNQTHIANTALYLLLHSRGKVFVIQPLKSLIGQIQSAILPDGIATFSIIDSTGTSLCERLIFERSSDQPVISMESDKPVYGKREPVKLKMNLKALTGQSLAGSFAVTVTEDNTVRQDSLAGNIISYLLLSSDIKGYIEDPAAYFKDNSASTREKMDVLMMTQGWRRFNTSQIAKGQLPGTNFYLEAGQALSGKVKNLFGKPSKKCDVILLSAHKNMFRVTQTDSLGRYLIDGIDFPDSTSVILKATKRKTIGDVEIVPDSDIFLKSTIKYPFPVTRQNPAPSAYFEQSKEKYYYEGGMRVINLKEVTIEAEKVKDTSNKKYFSGMGDSQLSSKDLERFPGMSIMMVLSTIPGVQVQGDQISIRGNTGSPHIMVDGFGTERIEDISYLTTNDIESIEVFKGASAAIFGFRGGNGVIAISLKSGAELQARGGLPVSLVQKMPLGYQRPSEFYVPKYEVESIRRSSKPDLRTTIYWNPEVQTDSTGSAQVNFYTADNVGTYTVLMEGITGEGQVCRYVGKLKRED